MPKCLVIPLPVSPIERLAAKFRDVLHLPDPSALYVLMGTVAANLMSDGPPVWLMLVGPPSCGKSELLNSLLQVPGLIEGADIASEAAFLSGTSKKDKAADATGGMLCQVGEHGGIILNDFTSVLSKPQDKIAQIMGVLRECFIGRWTRHVGGEGGRELAWTGRLTLLAGCTGRIDNHHQISAELGERWIYWRYDRTGDAFAETMMALSRKVPGWRDILRANVATFFEELGLSYGNILPRRDYTNPERVRIHSLGAMAARCRSGVGRDGYSHEVTAPREQELATRLSTVLGQLLIGMDYIGVPAGTRWRLLTKLALDSMPRLRKMVLEAVVVNHLTVEELRPVLGVGLSVVKRTIEDLEIHGIVRRQMGKVSLTDWMEERCIKYLV